MSWVMRVSVTLGTLTVFAALLVGVCALSYSSDMHIDETRGINEAGYVRIGGIE